MNIGDRVRIRDMCSSYYHWVGVVEETNSVYSGVRIDNRPLEYFTNTDLEPDKLTITFELTPPTVVSRECPCGIYRGDCEYHA